MPHATARAAAQAATRSRARAVRQPTPATERLPSSLARGGSRRRYAAAPSTPPSRSRPRIRLQPLEPTRHPIFDARAIPARKPAIARATDQVGVQRILAEIGVDAHAGSQAPLARPDRIKLRLARGRA